MGVDGWMDLSFFMLTLDSYGFTKDRTVQAVHGWFSCGQIVA